MKKINKNIPTLTIGFILMTFFFFSCNYEELEINPTDTITTQLQKDLKLDQFTNKNIAGNLTVNWQDVNIIEKEGFEIYEIGIAETNTVKISSKLFQESLKYELIAIKKDNVIYSYFIEAFSSVKNDLYTGTIQDLDNYSGTLNIFDLRGKQLGQLLVNNGTAKNPSNSIDLEQLEIAINLFGKSSKKGLTSKLPECNDTYNVRILNDIYEDRYEVWTYASGEVIFTKFIGTVYIGTEVTYEQMAVSYPCNSEYNNDDIHVPYITSVRDYVIVDLAIENNIDDSKLDPCPKGVMGQLKSATNADIASIMKKLGATSIYAINMVMEPAATYAETQRISKNNYVIRVDRTRSTDGTKLFKATALIHAYFLSIVDDYNNYPTNAPMVDFPTLFEAYVKKTYPNSNNTIDAQHKEMANKYVDAMASALQEYDANYTVPYQVYEDLAWGGLSAAPIFNETFKPGTAESIRITNRYKAESTGHSVGDGTPYAQTPVGKPCN